jgi:hypothetical protein
MNTMAKIRVIGYILITLSILFYQTIVAHKDFQYIVIYLLISIIVLIGVVVINS